MVSCTRADLRLGGIGTSYKHFPFGIGRTGVFDGVNDHNLNSHFLPDGSCQGSTRFGIFCGAL